MLVWFILASIPATFSTSMSAAPDVQSQVVRQSENGEFLAKHYPPRAFKRGEQGKVSFRLTIEPDGSLGTCDVTESSGFATLDKETCEVMVRYARMKPVRNEDGRAIRSVQPGHIVWKLPSGGPQLASTSAKSMPKPEQIVCKRSQTTGSLISKSKQCMTKREWAQQGQANRQEYEALQGKGYFEDGDACSGVGCP